MNKNKNKKEPNKNKRLTFLGTLRNIDPTRTRCDHGKPMVAIDSSLKLSNSCT